MEKFKGFPARMQFTPLPNLFFSQLLPHISDMAELKTTLHVLQALYQKRGYPRFITRSELAGNVSLMSGLKEIAGSPDEALRQALETATKRGAILHMRLDKDGAQEDIYFLNAEPDRRAMARIQNGELSGLVAGKKAEIETEALPDLFTLYEQNIGMLTPLIADELGEAEKLYPETWVRDAIKEAVTHGKRKWSYISAILERWSAEGRQEGRQDGTYRRDSKTDPDKYIKGKYGHMVRR